MPRGIVLNGRPEEGYAYPFALIFEHGYKSISDFKIIPIVIERIKFREVASRTLAERNAVKKQFIETETLIFGQMIEWDGLDMNGKEIELVRDYHKVPAVYEARMYDGETQLLVQGMMSKNRRVLWMLDLWPDVEVPSHLQQNSHPDVVVNVWVTLQIRPNQTLKYGLHSFVGPADTFQHLARNAQWNDGDIGNIELLYDPLSNDRPCADYAPCLSSIVTGMHGVVVSKKCILAEDEKHREICFHRIVLSDHDRFPAVGSYVKFNAEKIDFLNIYAVKDVVNIAENTSLPVTNHGQIKTTIKCVEDVPGFYFSKSLNIYVDDPDNFLEAWLISDYNKSTLQVAIRSAEPSDKGTARYIVTEVVDAKKKKIADLRATGKLVLENELAVVTEEIGILHVPRVPKSEIRLSKEDAKKYPPGTVLRISAVLQKKWKVTSAQVDRKLKPFHAVSTFNEVTEMDMILFSVPELRGVREIPALLYSPIFGFVQTPRSFRILRNPDRAVYKDVWITLNDCHPGDDILPAARFKIFSLGDPDVDVERISQHDAASSSQRQSTELADDPNYRRALALNNARIPAVNRLMGDDEFDDMMRTQGINIPTMMAQLEMRPDWKKNPAATIEQEIQKHVRSCNSCTEATLGDSCYFSEYLGLALQSKPEIVEALKRKNLLTPVILRRFYK